MDAYEMVARCAARQDPDIYVSATIPTAPEDLSWYHPMSKEMLKDPEITATAPENWKYQE